MLEETNPPYSHIARLYVPKRSHVCPSPCRRSLPRRVGFCQRRSIQLGLSRCHKTNQAKGRRWPIRTFHENKNSVGRALSDARIASRMVISR